MIERALDKGRRVGINEVAERLYTSRSKLCATFKAQTGESLGTYIRRRRMERAKDLLADSALTIAQVAERLGYPQQAAFAQAFKQHTGTTPTAWRSKHRYGPSSLAVTERLISRRPSAHPGSKRQDAHNQAPF